MVRLKRVPFRLLVFNNGNKALPRTDLHVLLMLCSCMIIECIFLHNTH